jgi:DNA-binding beta-propeller fold protein YncE
MLLAGMLMVSGWSCFTGCSRHAARPESPEMLVIYPPPPAPTRIQFLTYISSSSDMEGNKGKIHEYLFGKEDPVTIIKPYGVTVHANKVYICDTGRAGLVVLDLSRGALKHWVPGGRGQLQLPINCDIDEDGLLFVADANRRQVVVFDSGGNFVTAFGEQEKFKPTDVVAGRDTIWVASVEDHAVHLYSAGTYHHLGAYPGRATGEAGSLRQPTNIAFRNHEIFVSDFGDFNVKKISPAGEVTGTVGAYGNGPGHFTRPKGVALDRDGNLYVVDAAFQNVQIFNHAGQMLMDFGGSYDGPGAMWLPAAVAISYENLAYFQPYVDPGFELKYLIYVTNQYGPAKLNVYGFVEEKKEAS